MTSTDVSVAVVMPAYNAAHHLSRTLPALQAAAGEECEIIVVDPGSTDDTAAVAESFGVRVHRLGKRAGPAEARNAGVALTAAEVVLFVDSDCEAAPNIVDITRSTFANAPDLVTLTGSYDETPADQGFFSLYMNLRHHFTHQRAMREPATFWAGCGAVRREVFEKVGGFDADRFPRPMIEDIELGSRMSVHGRCVLDPDLQVKHLKAWSGTDVIRTDIFSRAVPWTRLIASGGSLPNDLNLRLSQRLAAALAPFVLSALALAWVAPFVEPLLLIVLPVLLGAAFTLSGDMFLFFARTRNWPFAVLAILFHQVHLSYSAVTFAIVTVMAKLGWRGGEAS